jgi:hypothetical protein
VILYTSDYFSYYVTLVGWIINDGIWNILVASGVVALPFIAIVLQEWLRARTEGADEGNKGVLSSLRIENRVWVAIVVILFAGMPMIPISLATIQFDASRSTRRPRRAELGGADAGRARGLRAQTRKPQACGWFRGPGCEGGEGRLPERDRRRPRRYVPWQAGSVAAASRAGRQLRR